MAQKQLTLPGTVVKKHNVLVRSKIVLDSHQASKILASLIACIHKDDKQFKEAYRISVKNFLPDTGGGSYRQAKAACRELAKATVEFEYPDPENPDDDPIFVALPFFSSVKYRKGIVEARFNSDHEIANCLLVLQKHFTQLNLIEYLRLPSIYSQRIFEILMSWVNTDNEKTYTLDELHHMLNTPESFRKKFPDFRRKVLEKAHKDINGKTNLTYAWEPVKLGKAVVAIRFIFSPKLRAIAAASAKQTAQAKQSAANNRYMQAAVKCARAKMGICTKQDNKPKVCELCLKYDVCQDVRAKEFSFTN
jgi:plasmid replication initiation protein